MDKSWTMKVSNLRVINRRVCGSDIIDGKCEYQLFFDILHSLRLSPLLSSIEWTGAKTFSNHYHSLGAPFSKRKQKKKNSSYLIGD